MRRAAARVLILAAGCAGSSSTSSEAPPSTPLRDVRTLAVLPVYNQTGQPTFDGEEFGTVLATELLKVPGYRVVRPAALRAAGQTVPRTAEEALRLGRTLKADAVLVVAVTDHQPYDPPRIAVSVQLFRTSPRGMSGSELDRLVESASWKRGPLEMSADKAGHWIAAFEELFDAREERVRGKIRQYARTEHESDSGFLEEREFLAVQSRFFQFVSSQILRRALEGAAAP